MAQNKIKAITLASIDSTTFDTTYLPINSSGLEQPCTMIRITNDSSVDVTVSYDGTTDNDYIRTGEVLQLSIQTNSLPNGDKSLMAKGTKVYVKAAASTGLVYLAGYYNSQN